MSVLQVVNPLSAEGGSRDIPDLSRSLKYWNLTSQNITSWQVLLSSSVGKFAT